MNKELERLATMAGWYTNDQGDGTVIVDPDFAEKFATLVITQCAVIATRCQSQGQDHPGAVILNHFGI